MRHDHFTIDTSIESLYCAPKTNTVFYVICVSIKKKYINGCLHGGSKSCVEREC